MNRCASLRSRTRIQCKRTGSYLLLSEIDSERTRRSHELVRSRNTLLYPQALRFRGETLSGIKRLPATIHRSELGPVLSAMPRRSSQNRRDGGVGAGPRFSRARTADSRNAALRRSVLTAVRWPVRLDRHSPSSRPAGRSALTRRLFRW
jgi:hypothetical protein